jgi:hypothetical protein
MIAELDRLDGAPMAKQRRGLQMVDGGAAKPRRRLGLPACLTRPRPRKGRAAQTPMSADCRRRWRRLPVWSHRRLRWRLRWRQGDAQTDAPSPAATGA